MLFEEEGVVEASSGGAAWIKKLAGELEKAGIQHEYEGESLRMHLGDLVVEVTLHPEGGFMVSLQIPLPSGSEDEDPEYYGKLYATAVKLIQGLGGPIEYSLDTSLPDYPMLHASKRYDDPWRLVDELLKALQALHGD